MSAEFHIRFEDTVFRVKIDRDGTMTILDPPMTPEDMEYEIAVAAMGGERSLPLRLHDTWDTDPITTIVNHLPGMSNSDLNLLALDWARHVLPIYTAALAVDHQQRMSHIAWLLLKAGKSFVAASTPSKKDQTDISNYAALTAEWAEGESKTENNSNSSKAWSAWYAIAALSMAMYMDPRRCADRAADAFARKDGPEEGSDEFYAEYRKEQAWQVRHFVAVMTALQAGKNWPPMGATP